MSSDNRFEPLPSELRRRKSLAQIEAIDGFDWIDGCPPAIGRKVAAALEMLTDVSYRVYAEANKRRGYANDGQLIESAPDEALKGEGDDSQRLDVLAAVVYSFIWLAQHDEEEVETYDSYVRNSPPVYAPEKFVDVVNDILLHGRIDWTYEDDKFQERGNSVLHSGIVRPASIFLDADPRFASASSGFQAALTRLSKNEPDVAITDAGSAVQEFFRALGIHGNSISDQLNNAQKLKLITAYDRSLLKPIVDWVNSDRSDRGNAHHYRSSDATKADAWLAIHVAGALMVRLSNEKPRDIIAAREQRIAKAEETRRAEQERLEAEIVAAEASRAALSDPWGTSSNYSAETPF